MTLIFTEYDHWLFFIFKFDWIERSPWYRNKLSLGDRYKVPQSRVFLISWAERPIIFKFVIFFKETPKQITKSIPLWKYSIRTLLCIVIFSTMMFKSFLDQLPSSDKRIQNQPIYSNKYNRKFCINIVYVYRTHHMCI